MGEAQASSAKPEDTLEPMRTDDKAAEIARFHARARVHDLEEQVRQLRALLHLSERREKRYSVTFSKLVRLLKVEKHTAIISAVEGLLTVGA